MLERMLDAQQINTVFCFPESGMKRMAAEHDGIREALFFAVNQTHVRHADLPLETLQAIAGHLLGYSRVSTTNYDLLPYWSIMSSPCGTNSGICSVPRAENSDSILLWRCGLRCGPSCSIYMVLCTSGVTTGPAPRASGAPTSPACWTSATGTRRIRVVNFCS